jgi:glucose-1-phosphate adenylyltransferase
MPKELSRQFGVMVVDKNYRIVGFQEKPEVPETMPSNPDLILASMGIYVFNTEKMVKRIVEDAKRTTSSHDFGKNVIPHMIDRDKVFAFPFVDEVTGRPAYWRDVGTIEAYWEAHMDLLSRDPEFSLLNRKWPIYTYEPPTPPAKVISAGADGEGIQNSIVSGGALIVGSRVTNSVIGRNVSIYEGSEIEESIIMDRVKIGSGARLKKVIIDKNVTIPEGMEIGLSREEDEKSFDVTGGGIVVVAKMTKFD